MQCDANETRGAQHDGSNAASNANDIEATRIAPGGHQFERRKTAERVGIETHLTPMFNRYRGDLEIERTIDARHRQCRRAPLRVILRVMTLPEARKV